MGQCFGGVDPVPRPRTSSQRRLGSLDCSARQEPFEAPAFAGATGWSGALLALFPGTATDAGLRVRSEVTDRSRVSFRDRLPVAALSLCATLLRSLGRICYSCSAWQEPLEAPAFAGATGWGGALLTLFPGTATDAGLRLRSEVTDRSRVSFRNRLPVAALSLCAPSSFHWVGFATVVAWGRSRLRPQPSLGRRVGAGAVRPVFWSSIHLPGIVAPAKTGASSGSCRSLSSRDANLRWGEVTDQHCWIRLWDSGRRGPPGKVRSDRQVARVASSPIARRRASGVRDAPSPHRGGFATARPWPTRPLPASPAVAC